MSEPGRGAGLLARLRAATTPRQDAGRWRRGGVTTACAAAVAFLLAFPSAVPNSGRRLGSLLETFLPWLGLAVPVLLTAALLRRSATALVVLLIPVAVWLGRFGPLLVPAGDVAHDLVAVQHNVSDVNARPADTARALSRGNPQIIALEELTPAALPLYEKALAAGHPHHAVVGSVGVWSVYPLADVRPVDIKPRGIGPGWSRGLRATTRTPAGDVAVYVAHLPSVRVGVPDGLRSAWRDESAALLGRAIAAEDVDRLVLLGDLNATVDDRGLGPVAAEVRVSGPGLAFSWPAAFPLARIDQIMTRSATVTDVRTLPATGSDHLPLAARIRF